MNLVVKLVGFVVSLVLVVIVGILLVAQFRPNSATVESQSTNPNKANALAVLASTPTAALVVLPAHTVVPTATRRPIATKSPTATPVPLDEATIAYVQQLMLDIEELLDAQQQVGDLLATPLPNDLEWNRQIQAVITQLQAIHNRQVPINPPPMFAYYHLVFMEATEFCSYLYLNFSPGETPTLDNIDIARMTSLSCYDMLTETMEQMPELPPHSIPDPHLAKTEVAVTPIPSVAQSGATAAQDANLRAGPGTDFEIIGNVAVGSALIPIGRNDAGDWLQLDSGAWIAAFLVSNATPLSAIPVVGVIESTIVPGAQEALLPAEPQQEPPPPTIVPQAPVQSCDPNYSGACIPNVGYDLNCPDVGAKDFYSVGSDPHGFDSDYDGIACES